MPHCRTRKTGQVRIELAFGPALKRVEVAFGPALKRVEVAFGPALKRVEVAFGPALKSGRAGLQASVQAVAFF